MLANSRTDILIKRYDDLFSKLRLRMEKHDSGFLYKTIFILLEQEQDIALEICREFKIREDGSLNDDIAVSDLASNLADLVLVYRDQDKGNFMNSILAIFGLLKNKMLSNTEIRKILNDIRSPWEPLANPVRSIQNDDPNDNDDYLLFKIVVIATILIGIFFATRFLEGKRSSALIKDADQFQKSSLVIEKLKPLPVSLSLVVQASEEVSNLSECEQLDVNRLASLIDSSSYFLCETRQKIDSVQEQLEFTSEVVVTNLNREVYLRIDLDDGKDVLTKKNRYIIKRNLKPNQVGRLAKKAYLKTLFGLEKFNRV